MPAAVMRIKPRRSLVLLVVLSVAMASAMVVLARQADAAISDPFTLRFTDNKNGAILLRGNANLVCADGDTGCPAGKAGTSSTLTELDNNNYSMGNSDNDSDGTTFNSSSAQIILPTGSTVLYAALYWSADTAAGGGGGAAAPSAANKDKVKFRAPGAAGYTDLTADTTYTNGNAYQGFKNVTSTVGGAGSGVYSVANIQAGTGQDKYAGWALAIAYAHPNERTRILNIWDGFGVVKSGDTTGNITVTNFTTPNTGPIGAAIGTVVYEGDRGKTGEALEIFDGTTYQPLTDGKNPAGNVFNSTVTQGGVDVAGRTPNNNNLMGVDIDRFDTSGVLSPNQTSTTLRMTTGGETFYPGVVTFAIDLIFPNVITTPTGTDLNGGDVLPGDIIEYRVDVRNDGTDKADNVVVTDAIPTHTTYVPSTLKVNGVTKTDATDADSAEVGGGSTTFRLGSLAAAATGYVVFRVRVDDSAQPGDVVLNTSSATYTANATGDPGTGVPGTDSKTVQQPKTNLAAGLTVGPSTVQKANAPESVTYTATVSNQGTDMEPVATVKLTLPAGVTPDTTTPGAMPNSCAVTGQEVNCTIGAVNANTVGTVDVPAIVSASAAAHPSATLVVAGSGADSDLTDNTTTAALTVNSAPVAVGDTATDTTIGQPVVINVLANDTDADEPNTALTVQIVDDGLHGGAVANANGTVTYTPNPQWGGDDSFTYNLLDGQGGISNTVTVAVKTLNAAPTAGTHNYATAADTAKTVSPVADGDSDPNGDTPQVTAVGTVPAGTGTTQLNADQTITFTPAKTFRGTATFSYQIADAQNATANGTVNITVANAKPVAMNDTATVAYGGTTLITVLGNDTDDNNETLNITAVGTTGTSGTVTQQGNQIQYQALTGFSGTDTLTYTISDGTDTATATVTVTVGNAAPVAGAGTAQTDTNQPVTFDARDFANDPDDARSTLTVSATGPTANGGTVVKNANGTLTYTPVTAYAGPDSFTYAVTDPSGATGTNTITVTVRNAVPVAGADSLTVPAGVATSLPVKSNDSDANNDPLTVTVDVPPAHGTATPHANGTVTYTPATGYLGADTFHYKVSDGRGGEAGATVTLSVVNVKPTAVTDADTTDTNTAKTLNVRANDTDPNGDTLTVTATTTPAHGAVVINLDSTVTYTPDNGFSGSDSFTYTVSDGKGGTDTVIVTITVNDAAPIGVDDAFVVRPGVKATLDVLTNDTDPNTGQTLSVKSVSPAGKGTVKLESDGTVTYLTSATSGTDTFDYEVADNLGMSHTATVILTIDAAPIATADAVPTASGTAVDIPVLSNDTDPESQALTLVSVTTPAHGTAQVVGNEVRYTPGAGFFGADTFSYVVRDTAGNTATGTVTVNVANGNPVAVDTEAAVLANHSVDITVVNSTDPNPGQELTLSAVGTPQHGTATIVDGKIRYVPAIGFTGTDTFTYTITDGNGGTATANVTVTVSDGTPVALDDTRTTPYQKAVTIAVLGNDLDPNGELTVTAVTTPQHGTASFTATAVVYTPAAGYSGTDTFAYTATDVDGHEVTATVTVTVGTPPAVPNKSVTAKPGAAVTIPLPTVDENGKPVTITGVGEAEHGTVKLNDDGTVTYTPDEGFAGVDSFSYEVVDADGNVATAMIDVTVAGAGTNTAPRAANDSASVVSGRSVVIRPRNNDADPDGDPLTVTRIDNPEHGVAVLQSNGTVVYAPTDGYTGTDSFTYTISDGNGGTAGATVTITVTAAAGNGSSGGNDNLALTGEDLMSVATVGLMVLLVGGTLVVFANRGLPVPVLFTGNGHGRHRPGRHRQFG